MQRSRRRILALATWLAVLLAAPATALAEVGEVRIARQYGIGYLALMIMERDRLLEKHAKAAGLGDIKVTWQQFAGGNVMNDALISGSLDFGAVGTTVLVRLWERTRGTPQEVKGVCSFGSFAFFLNTRNPAVRSIRDLTDKDRIAVPAVKVSNQALMLQLAAEKTFGDGQAFRLDPFTVTMGHPDATTALLSGSSEINGHFTWDPFHSRQLQQPGVRTILSSVDVLGGPATTIVIVSTTRFRQANPKTYAAFLAAFEEATATINRSKRSGAEAYVQILKEKPDAVPAIEKMLAAPHNEFTLTPQNTMRYASFMHKIGNIKEQPASWRDMFFPEMHDRGGS